MSRAKPESVDRRGAGGPGWNIEVGKGKTGRVGLARTLLENELSQGDNVAGTGWWAARWLPTASLTNKARS